MNSTILTLVLALAPTSAPDSSTPDSSAPLATTKDEAFPALSTDVIVELKNGYRIRGKLVERENRWIVVAVGGGEMRFDLRRISRVESSAIADARAAAEAARRIAEVETNETELNVELPRPPPRASSPSLCRKRVRRAPISM